MKNFIIILLIMLMIFCPLEAEAFWWLFGKNQDQVNISYLYINGISYDESGQEITLYQDLLEDGLINIQGRAVIRKGTIGSVLVSIDGKETWDSAELSDDGAFQYYFSPEIGREYEIYIEAMETAGRTNEVDETYKKVIVSESNYQQVIEERLAEMFTAYEMQNINSFMEYVSWDFVGGDVILEQALNKDFSNFADIAIEYNLINLAINNDGMISIVLQYDRRLISNNDGSTLADSGLTEFVFNLEEQGPVLYSMSYPLIFGVSDASNVASGVINSAENEQVIAVDDQGNIELKSIDEIVNETAEMNNEDDNSGGSEMPAYESGEKSIASVFNDENGNWYNQGYRFSDGQILERFTGYCDFYIETNIIFLNDDVRVLELNETDINNVTELPETGYVEQWDLPYGITWDICYGLSLPDGNYAVVYFEEAEEVNSEYDADIGEVFYRIRFKYKYRDDGGRQF